MLVVRWKIMTSCQGSDVGRGVGGGVAVPPMVFRLLFLVMGFGVRDGQAGGCRETDGKPRDDKCKRGVRWEGCG